MSTRYIMTLKPVVTEQEESHRNAPTIKAPVMLNATDAALLMNLLIKKISDRYSETHDWMIDVMRNGSEEYRK